MTARFSAYRLVVTSHRGGAGRTTTALALAGLAVGRGLAVGFIDACDEQAALRTAESAPDAAPGDSPFTNVPRTIFDGSLSRLPEQFSDRELLVIDAPPLGREAERRLLVEADGVLITSRADAVSLRTFPRAAQELLAARQTNPRLELLGLLLVVWDGQDISQQHARTELQSQFGRIMRDPPVPYQRSLSEWPLHPGAAPPPGPATSAYGALLDRLQPKFSRPPGGAPAHDQRSTV